MSQQITDTVVRNTAGNVPFSDILQASLSRRTLARGGLSAALVALTGGALSGCGSGDAPAPLPSAPPAPGPTPALQLGFASLPNAMTDACVVPAGYVARVLGA